MYPLEMNYSAFDKNPEIRLEVDDFVTLSMKYIFILTGQGHIP